MKSISAFATKFATVFVMYRATHSACNVLYAKPRVITESHHDSFDKSNWTSKTIRSEPHDRCNACRKKKKNKKRLAGGNTDDHAGLCQQQQPVLYACCYADIYYHSDLNTGQIVEWY